MPLIATAGDSKTYTPAPEGTHQAVCVDVIDKGMLPNPFKEGALQHKVDVAWQIDERRDDGKRHLVFKRYTLSLNEKATLRHDLESWRGKAFSRDEEMGFDVESVIGVNCLINIQHKTGTKDPSKVFANVKSVMSLPKNMPKMFADEYQRAKDDTTQPAADAGPEVAGEMVADDEIPF